jgi:small subunit ribosomal protein S15
MEAKEFSIGVVDLPKEFAFGVDAKEKELLFEDLPVASAQMTVNTMTVNNLPPTLKDVKDEEKNELLKANLLAKALDLRNANAAGIAFENRRRIIKTFSTPENPYDTGRTEVQGA